MYFNQEVDPALEVLQMVGTQTLDVGGNECEQINRHLEELLKCKLID
jgi:hypothetical protein